MPSETDLINVGLRRIGATPITSLTDGSKSANAADDIYTELRDDLLRSHPWNFAIKRRKLAQSSNTPVFGFDYAYPLPSDWIKTVSVHNNDAGAGTTLYRMEQLSGQRVFVTAWSALWLIYVSRVTDPNMMPPDFRTTLSFLIGRDLAVPLASSNTLEDKMAGRAERSLARARSADGMGSFPVQRPIGSWASARGGRGRNFMSD